MPILTKIRNSLLSTTGAPTAKQTRSQKMSKKIWKSSLSQTSSLLFILGQTFSITLRQSRVCPTANTVLQIHKYKNTNKSTNTKIQPKYKHNYKLKCKYNLYFHPQAISNSYVLSNVFLMPLVLWTFFVSLPWPSVCALLCLTEQLLMKCCMECALKCRSAV